MYLSITPFNKTWHLSQWFRIIWSVRHVEDDARFHVRWKHCGDSGWLGTSKMLEISTHTCPSHKKKASIVLPDSNKSYKKFSQEYQLSVCCPLLTHTLFLSTNTGFKNLPGPWAGCHDNGTSHGGIFFQTFKSEKVTEYSPCWVLKPALCILCENITWKLGGVRRRENLKL